MPPFVDYTIIGTMNGGNYQYSLDMLISNICLIKSYTIVRVYNHYSPWTNTRAHLISLKRNFIPNISFSFRSDLKNKNVLLLLIIFFSLAIYFGLIMRNFEKSFINPDYPAKSFNFKWYLNGVWLEIVTVTTVGYGDGFPESLYGRSITLFTCVFG